MDSSPCLFALGLAYFEQLSGVIPREQYPALFEGLADRGEPVCFAVLVPRGIRGLGRGAVVEGRDVAAGEDVRRGEGRGSLDAVEEKDFVLGREKEDAVLCLGSRQCGCNGGVGLPRTRPGYRGRFLRLRSGIWVLFAHCSRGKI